MTRDTYLDPAADLEARVDDLLSKLTLDEKFKLSLGKNSYSMKGIARLDVPSLKMTDGPHGVAAHSSGFKRATDFPATICTCATWDTNLAYEIGIALGKETRAFGKHMILGPGVNIQRTPLCGRTFEYLTEDPFLNKKVAVQIVKGIQSRKISACVKHFAANSQENDRMTINSQVGERALQEIYLPAFQATVEEADAWGFMACYNKVNGVYGCENHDLLTERLRNEWGFRGFVVSDWFAAARTTSTASCMNAGLSLDMPGGLFSRRAKYKLKKLRKAYANNEFSLEILNENVRRLLRVIFLAGLLDPPSSVPEGEKNSNQIHSLVRKVAGEGMVLLKNEGGLLPLRKEKITKIAILGPNAKKKMGWIALGGSSGVWPPYEVTPYMGITKACKNEIRIVKSPADADVAIVVAGLNHLAGGDSEAFDRKELELPTKQEELINATAAVNPNTIVVLIAGSPIAMNNWIGNVRAVIMGWYGGLECGNALADIIFGKVNPSGKLPITFPKRLEDSPAHVNVPRTYPGESGTVYYDEGIFVGYRHFDTRGIEPLFPFGFGLSYTTFELSSLSISPSNVKQGEMVTVSLSVKNTGDIAGAEVVQLYLNDEKATVERPIKELKGFQKVFLLPGESKDVTLTLENEDLMFYDEKAGMWRAEKGTFNVMVGTSSREIKLEGSFEYAG